MINQSNNPEARALLVQELDAVREHLVTLARQMESEGRIDDEDFAVQVGRAYGHLE